MRVVSYDRVEKIDAPRWDSAAPPDFFFQRSFLRVMQESGVERARYRFLLLLEADGPVGVAVLSAFTLRLDLLAGDPWVRRLRRWAPRLLDVPIICCGIPASYGQHHLHVTRPECLSDAVRLVCRYMDEWAEEERCGLLFWKEWNPGQAASGALRATGYLPLPTLADHRVRGALGSDDSASAFLASLRSTYRRKYRAAAALLRGPGPAWTAGPLHLEVSRFGPADAAAFVVGYNRVMDRVSIRLETYPAAFFEELARSAMDVRLLRLAHRESGESLAALLYASGPVLTFALVSKELPRYRDALYTTLLRCIVLYGLRSGYREVRLGQTSSYAKCSVGAEPWRLETLVRARARWQHALLARLGSVLFPEAESPRLSVFRERDIDGHVRRAAPAVGALSGSR